MRDLPGVDPDGKNPGGLEVAGNVEAHTITRDGVTVGAPYPDVTSDGQTPGGLNIGGEVTVGALPGSISHLLADSLNITAADDNNLKLTILLAEGSSGTEIQMQDSHGVNVWRMDADGTEHLHGGLNVIGDAAFTGVIGEHGKAAAAAPTAITGTITAATLTQLTAIVLALLQALDTKGSIVNSTT